MRSEAVVSPLMHPAQHWPAGNITDAYSLEASTKDIAALSAAAPRILPASTIAIPYLAREDDDARLAAARAVRRLGFEPMPHLSARRIVSLAGLAPAVEEKLTALLKSSRCGDRSL